MFFTQQKSRIRLAMEFICLSHKVSMPFYLLALLVSFVFIITRHMGNLQICCQHSQEEEDRMMKGKGSKR